MYKQHNKEQIKKTINEILDYQKTNETMMTLNEIMDMTDKQVKMLYSTIEKNQTLTEEESVNLTKYTKLNKEAEEKFKQQLKDANWKISDEVDIENFFTEHQSDFLAFGRDTNRLVFYCKLCHNEIIFDNYNDNNNGDRNREITTNILDEALKYLRDNRIKDNSESDKKYDHMMYM